MKRREVMVEGLAEPISHYADAVVAGDTLYVSGIVPVDAAGVLVVNNGMYGTIRMHQERHYPGRVVGTGLRNPDFVAYARAFGAHGALVERSDDFPAALDEALECGRPALIELRVDPQAITPRQTLDEIRAASS